MKKKYTHLFFDLDNTLWNFERNSFDAMHAVFEQLNIAGQGVDFNNFFSIYSKNNRQCWQDYRNGKLVKQELVIRRFEKTFDECSISGIDPLTMNSLYLADLPGRRVLVEGAFELLEFLKMRGYRLHIITNGFREVQYKKIELTGLGKYFTKVFISEEIKAPKPSDRIFRHAVKSANARKKSSLMIGDDFEADVIGAVNYGIDAAYFGKSHHSAFPEPNKKYDQAVYFVQKLMDLTAFL